MENQNTHTTRKQDRVMQQAWMQRGTGWKNDILVAFLLMGFAFFVNRHMKLSGLYMDDLYQWWCYGEQSFREAVFTIGGSRFRFLYNLAVWVQMALFGPHVNWYVPFNILINTGIAFTMYRIGHQFSRSTFVGILVGILYLVSRMSYYQIGQVLGLMESMALWMAIMILYLLFGYLNRHDGREYRRIYLASLLYVAVCFVHERYMVLFPLFFIVLIFKKSRDWKLWTAPTLGFVLVQVVRFLTIGTIAPAGTGGTEVTETLSVGSIIHFAFSQIAYIFGINAGPEHLNGQNFREAPLWVMLLIAVADLMLLILVIAFLMKMVSFKGKCISYLMTAFLFVAFIGACIACSSVTIRVEMRWVYVSYSAALLFMAWMYGVLTDGMADKGLWMQAVPFLGMLTVYAVLTLPVESYYRSLYPNLYYWPEQERYNSLAEETYGNYGDGIFGKTIYIVGNKFKMSKFTEETFFKVFDRQKREDCVAVKHIMDVREIGLVNDNMLVIQEDPEHNRFQDVTHVVKTFKCRPIYGYYDDNWLDERAEIQVMAGSTGEIHLTLNYPRDLSEDQWTTIYVNGEAQTYLEFKENTETTTIKVAPFEPVTLRFESNFYVPNALEKRGATKLALLLGITAD